jgi:glutamate---cysteine ligase / carboxylate-amine ligase
VTDLAHRTQIGLDRSLQHSVRTIGVEEELLLVDPHDGRAVPLGMEVLGRHRVSPGAVSAAGAFGSGAFEALEPELKLEQVETATPPRANLQLGRVLVRGSGARRQRQVAAATGRLSDVVADAVERTSAKQPNPGLRTR